LRLYAGIDPVTKRQRLRSKTFEAKGQQKARRVADKIVGEFRRDAAQAAAERGTVGDMVDQWRRIQESKGRSPLTLQRDWFICKRIVERLGRVPVRDLKARDVEDWHVWLRELNSGTKAEPRHMSERTVVRHHSVLSSVLSTAERRGYVDTNVARLVRPTAKAKQIEVPDSATLRLLFDSARPSLSGIAQLAAFTGLRRGELFGLTWADVEPDRIRVRRSVIQLPGGVLIDKAPKSGAERDVPIPPEVYTALQKWRAELETALGGRVAADVRVVPDLGRDPSGRTPKRPDWLSHAWREHCKAQGVHVRWHDLRHWYATVAVNAGVPTRSVQAALGHAQVDTTMRLYVHETDEGADRLRGGVHARELMKG
jgi:integrase